MADPLAATRRLGPALLDVPRGTPPLLVPRVRRLASVSAISLRSPHPGRGTRATRRRRAPAGRRDRAGRRPAGDRAAPGPTPRTEGAEGGWGPVPAPAPPPSLPAVPPRGWLP